jgi:hypothetical protein
MDDMMLVVLGLETLGLMPEGVLEIQKKAGVSGMQKVRFVVGSKDLRVLNVR